MIKITYKTKSGEYKSKEEPSEKELDKDIKVLVKSPALLWFIERTGNDMKKYKSKNKIVD